MSEYFADSTQAKLDNMSDEELVTFFEGSVDLPLTNFEIYLLKRLEDTVE